MYLTKENCEQVVADWYKFSEEKTLDNIEEDCAERFEDDDYIDRYYFGSVNNDVEFNIVTDKVEKETYLSHDFNIQLENALGEKRWELVSVEELEEAIKKGGRYIQSTYCL
jgi:hypothetical protein